MEIVFWTMFGVFMGVCAACYTLMREFLAQRIAACAKDRFVDPLRRFRRRQSGYILLWAIIVGAVAASGSMLRDTFDTGGLIFMVFSVCYLVAAVVLIIDTVTIISSDDSELLRRCGVYVRRDENPPMDEDAALPVTKPLLKIVVAAPDDGAGDD